MLTLLLLLHYFALAYLIHGNTLLTAHVCSYALDHVELELEEPMKQAQAENLTNLALDQGKPQHSQPMLLVFYFEYIIYFLSFD
jgi:hypothetical protein